MAAQMRQAVEDFDHPLQMLKACHDRIKAQCETLHKLAAHLPIHGCDALAQEAASNVMRYFDSAGRHHREDEENDLFPLVMLVARGQNAGGLAPLIDQLHREHEEIEQIWLKLRDALETIAYGENAPMDDLEVDRLCGMYREHFAIEEANIFPLAAKILTPEQLSAFGRGMRQRRGNP